MKNLTVVTENKFIQVLEDEKGNLFQWNKGTSSDRYIPVRLGKPEDCETSIFNQVNEIGIVQDLKTLRSRRAYKSSQVIVG